MDATILRHEVLKQMDTGLPFDMEVVAADRKRGTGGELLRLEGWQKIVREPGAATLRHAQGDTHAATQNSKPDTRNPNHRTHKTLNIHNPNNNRLHPITIHIALIQFFNGKRVIN